MHWKKIHEALLYFPPYCILTLLGLIFLAIWHDDADCEADLYFDPQHRPHHGIKL